MLKSLIYERLTNQIAGHSSLKPPNQIHEKLYGR